MTPAPRYGSGHSRFPRRPRKRKPRPSWPTRLLLAALSRPLVVVVLLVSFGAAECLIYVSTQAHLVAAEYKLQDLKEQYAKALDLQRRLLVELGAKANAERIIQFARAQDDMVLYGADAVDIVPRAKPAEVRLVRAQPSLAENIGLRVASWCADATRRLYPGRREVQVAASPPSSATGTP